MRKAKEAAEAATKAEQERKAREAAEAANKAEQERKAKEAEEAKRAEEDINRLSVKHSITIIILT